MRNLRFGRTNADVPTISLGTWGHGGPNTNEGVSVGWTGHDDRLAKEALIEAYHRGITHWDTADAYGGGHAEQLIGEVFAHDVPRSAIFVATKFGYVKGPANHYYDTPFMRVQLEASLANMRTDVVDVYSTSAPTTATSTTPSCRPAASATRERSASSASPTGTRRGS